MTYYCINCWHEIKKDTVVCPHCGFDQKETRNISFTEKLIKALKHPEPETPIRVAAIIGKLKLTEAIPYILLRLKTETDPFIIKSLVESIIAIKPEMIDEIKKILGDNIPITIKKILEK